MQLVTCKFFSAFQKEQLNENNSCVGKRWCNHGDGWMWRNLGTVRTSHVSLVSGNCSKALLNNVNIILEKQKLVGLQFDRLHCIAYIQNQNRLPWPQSYFKLEQHTVPKPLLKPPFPLSIRTTSEYLRLNCAIAYVILTAPSGWLEFHPPECCRHRWPKKRPTQQQDRVTREDDKKANDIKI